jgi:hypothetical protein
MSDLIHWYSRFYGVGQRAAPRPQQQLHHVRSVLAICDGLVPTNESIASMRGPRIEKDSGAASALEPRRPRECGRRLDLHHQSDSTNATSEDRRGKRSSALAYRDRPSSKTSALSRTRTKFCFSTVLLGLAEAPSCGRSLE